MLAVGAHLKNTVALTAGSNAFISQHIGDLETPQSFAAFKQVIESFRALYRASPVRVVADLHPDYLSSRYARTLGLPVDLVQHHYAHVAACMAENDLEGRVLGVSWDGTGYGPDGSVWGGEFLLTDDDGFERVATLRPFRLPGGERAVREPRRAALGLLYALHGAAVASRQDLVTVAAFEPAALALLIQALDRELNAPLTTSAGRLFDAVASLAGVRQISTFEGQAAMELEAAVDERAVDAYPFALTGHGATFAGPPWKAPATVVDWQPLVEAILADVAGRVPVGVISARFHTSLAKMIVDVAVRVGEPRVVLTGGCFQNRRLIELAVHALRDRRLPAVLAPARAAQRRRDFAGPDCGVRESPAILNGRFLMCLAVPGRIVSIEGDDPLLRSGRVDFSGAVKLVNLAYVPEAKVGDYVLVHVGFAISTVDEAEARLVFQYLKEMGDLADLEEGGTS